MGNEIERLEWVEDLESNHTTFVTTCGRFKVEQIRNHEAEKFDGDCYHYWIVNGDHDLQYDNLMQACGDAQCRAWEDYEEMETEKTEKQRMIQWLKNKKYKFKEFYYDYDHSGEHVKVLKKEEIVVDVIIDNKPGEFNIENVKNLEELVELFESNNVFPSR